MKNHVNVSVNKIKFKITEIKPCIFLFEFKDPYHLCMTFMRYQESYESQNPKFRNNSFSLLDFMEWYSKKDYKKNKYAFTYVADWGGFNLPNYVVDNIVKKGIPDFNKYDAALLEGYAKCQAIMSEKYESKKLPFYIIGTESGDEELIAHELAHGLFYTRPDYRKEMKALVKKLPKSVYKKVCVKLKEMGYVSQVYVDECQAYFSTGGVDRFFDKKFMKYTKPFADVFIKYIK